VIFAIGWYVFSSIFLWSLAAEAFQIFADRLMYLPSLGLCFALGVWLDHWRKRSSAHGRMIAVALIFVLAALMVATNARAKIWNNPYRLWTAVIRYSDAVPAARSMKAFALNMRARTVLEGDSFAASRQDILGAMMSRSGSRNRFLSVIGPQSLERKLSAVRFILAARDLRRITFDFYPILGMSDTSLFYTWAIAFDYIKNYRKAAAFLQEGLSRAPRDVQFLQYMGHLYERMGRIDEALFYYEKAVSAGRVLPSLFRRRAMLFYKQGRPREALSDALEWLSLKPDDEEMNAFALARALEVGDMRLAAMVSYNYVMLFPKHALSHAGRAEVLLRAGDCRGGHLELDRARGLGHVFTPAEERSFQAYCP
jgi:tetratricopeptide (TPR) repeat protein